MRATHERTSPREQWIAPPEVSPGPVRRRWLLRLLVRYVLPGLILVGALSALVILPALAARNHLLEAKRAMEAGRQELLAADASAAERSFRKAADSFSRSGGDARSPMLWLTGLLPYVGRSPDAVAAISLAGEDLANAGAAIAGGLATLPDGVGSLAPSRGEIPLDRFRKLTPYLNTAIRLMDEAGDIMSGVPSTWLLAPVAEARLQLNREILPLREKLKLAAALTTELPAFLGEDGARHYFFGAANPAELRGTIGLIGAFAILTADHGRLSFSSFRDIGVLPDVPETNLQPPNPDFGQLNPAGSWSGINVSPDFPTVARAMENLYRDTRDVRLDGTILADPFALQALMRVSGGAPLPALHLTVTARNVIPLMTNLAYGPLPNAPARKALEGEVARAVMERFLRGVGSVREAAEALGSAADGGHLLFHSADPTTQSVFDLAGVSGRLLPPGNDYLSVVVNNLGSNKVDYYASRAVRYSVRLQPGGSGTAALIVAIHNGAPRSGQPQEVIGPVPDTSKRGENVSVVAAYLMSDAVVQNARRDGRPVVAALDRELGHRIARNILRIASGADRTLRYSTTLPSAWRVLPLGGGEYSLTFQGQVGVVPTELTLEILSPPGTRIVRTSVPMRIVGNRAVFTGRAPYRQVFEVEFQPS